MNENREIVMRRIVLVFRSYPPETTANVVCMINVLEALKKLDQVKLICVCGTVGESKVEYNDGVEIHKIHHISYSDKIAKNNNMFKKLFYSIRHALHSVIVLPIFPNVEPIFSLKIYRELLRINTKAEIDCIVSAFSPYATIAGMQQFKKKHKQTKCIAFFLDVLRGRKPPFGISDNYYRKLCLSREKKLFKKVDKIILPEGSKVMFMGEEFESFNNKFRYVNFPVLRIKDSKENTLNNLRFVYTGTLDKHYRNPSKVIDIINKLKESGLNVCFDIYGKSDMEEELRRIQDRSAGAVVYHGMVPKEVADIACEEADYLINIGNHVAGMVPSKTFEMMGYKKPIIHFSLGDSDTATVFVKKYTNSLIVDMNEATSTASEKIMTFINKEKIQISDEELLREFYSATPEAIVDIISECLKED